MTSSPDNTVEEILRNRVKFVGDSEWTLLGSPEDLILELEAHVEARLKETDNLARIDELDKIKLDTDKILKIKDWVITRRRRLTALQDRLGGKNE